MRSFYNKIDIYFEDLDAPSGVAILLLQAGV